MLVRNFNTTFSTLFELPAFFFFFFTGTTYPGLTFVIMSSAVKFSKAMLLLLGVILKDPGEEEAMEELEVTDTLEDLVFLRDEEDEVLFKEEAF